MVIFALTDTALAFMDVVHGRIILRRAVDHLRKISSEDSSAAKNIAPTPSL